MDTKKLQCFILCFGRTDFTAATVDSLLENSSLDIEITLINNGWNQKIVPPAIYEYWQGFASSYRAAGKISEIIDVPGANVGQALDALSTISCKNPDSPYFVTDNDCIINTAGWDKKLISVMQDYPQIAKLGVDFYRRVSIEYSKKFSKYVPGLSGYLFAQYDNLTGKTVTADHCWNYFKKIGPATEFFNGDPRITKSMSDTTLSVVRPDIKISQFRNRTSYCISDIDMLHIGYLEGLYYSANEIACLEMLHYFNLRPMILTEFAENYAERRRNYVQNLLSAGHADLISKYNGAISRPSA